MSTPSVYLKLVADPSGERIPFLLDRQTGLPVSSANRWRLLARRGKCQGSTLAREMLCVGYVYRWAAENSIDLNERMAKYEGIRLEESVGFLAYLKQAFTEGELTGPVALHVSHAVQRQRIEIARSFLSWWFDLQLSRAALDRKISDARYSRLRDQKERMFRWMVAPPASSVPREGLPRTLRERFVEVIKPDAEVSPWRPHTRLRNYLILSLYFWTGLRLSELLALKIHHLDLDSNPPTLLVERTPDDPEDCRWDKPQAKTLGRKITLPSQEADSLREYVRRHRHHFGVARTHPFVFVSQPHGKPLSKRAVQHLLSEVVRKHKEFEGLLTVHVLRHCWSDMMHDHLGRLVKAGKIDPEFSRLLFNYLGGWSHGSFQSSRYSQAQIRLAADQALLAIHDDMFRRPS